MSQNKMSRCPQCGYEYNEIEYPQCPLCLGNQKPSGILIRLANTLIGLPRNVKLGLLGMSLVDIYFIADFLWKSMLLTILSTIFYGLFLYSWYRLFVFYWYKLRNKLELNLWFGGMLFFSYVPVIILIIVLYKL